MRIEAAKGGVVKTRSPHRRPQSWLPPGVVTRSRLPPFAIDRLDALACREYFPSRTAHFRNIPMPKKPPVPLTDQIRSAIDQSGLTRYRISKETGISESTLSKFYLKQRGLSMDALNALSECLQITINVGRKAETEGE